MLLCLFLAPMVLPSGEVGEFVSSLSILAWDNSSWEFHSKRSLSLPLLLSLSFSRLPRRSVPLEKGGDKRPGFPEEQEGKQGVCHPKIKKIKKGN